MFTFDETPRSRSEGVNPATFEMEFKSVGETNSAIVQEYAYLLTSAAIMRPLSGKLFRQDIRIESIGHAMYLVTVPYAPRKRDVGELSFSFDTAGATINVKAGIGHVASYTKGVAGADPNGNIFKGAINVKSDGTVEGTDIVIPALKLTYTLKHPAGIVTEYQSKVLASITGTVNLTPWRAFQAGELLFLGASGSDGSESEATLSYQFVASQNVTNYSVGEISNIAKFGHDIAWVEFENVVQNGQAAKQPKRVHVEMVYKRVDFASVLGFG